MSTPMTRAELYTLLAGTASLSAYEIIAEPPEQLPGAAIVIAPRSPYQSWDTYAEIETALTIHVLVPRMSGPAMDRIDAALVALRTALSAQAGVGIGNVASVGILDDLGGSKYVVASLDVTLTS